LTREDRYEEITGVTMPRRDGGSLVPHANVLRCRSCGSLLLAGDEDIHERVHPPISCQQAHPQRGRGLGHLTSHAPHAWEEQFQEEPGDGTVKISGEDPQREYEDALAARSCALAEMERTERLVDRARIAGAPRPGNP
jgi:hypothetical protein